MTSSSYFINTLKLFLSLILALMGFWGFGVLGFWAEEAWNIWSSSDG